MIEIFKENIDLYAAWNSAHKIVIPRQISSLPKEGQKNNDKGSNLSVAENATSSAVENKLTETKSRHSEGLNENTEIA